MHRAHLTKLIALTTTGAFLIALVAVTTGGAAANTVSAPARSPGWKQVAQLKGSDTVAGDEFGTAVAISGTTAVVGASYCDNLAGRAYVFTETTSGWSQTGELKGSDTVRADLFGDAVAVSGRTIVVGAPFHADNQGRAYVFTESPAGWKQTAELEGSDIRANTATAYDFGGSVAISGATLVVGASGADNGAGRAYVFTETAARWRQTGELKGAETVAGDYFGTSVAISGPTVVVGAPSGLPYTYAGATDVFTHTAAGWDQTADLKGSDAALQDNFGTSVALSGTTVVVGAPPNGAYVFSDTAAGWKQTAKLEGSDRVAAGGFAASVAISGRTIIAGANGEAGRAYLFSNGTVGWTQVADMKVVSHIATGDLFGNSVAISGTTAVVGAPLHAQHAGRAYVFEA